MGDDLRATLRKSYGRKAEERDSTAVQPWKAQKRRAFLEKLRDEGKGALLELGSGPGKDGAFFRDCGLDVLCTDLSPEMVARCKAKGLPARVMDVAGLDLPSRSFDAVYALNCLLHLPEGELPGALRGVHAVLKPGGLFYLGVYGGINHEGVWENDPYEPKRYFSCHTDRELRALVERFFEVESFDRDLLPETPHTGLHFQSLTLRRYP